MTYKRNHMPDACLTGCNWHGVAINWLNEFTTGILNKNYAYSVIRS